MQTLRLFLLLAFVGVVRAVATGPLDPCLAAHGGVERWQRLAFLGYGFEWTAGPRVITDARKVDLRSGTTIITAEKYTLGQDAAGAWVSPDALALGDVAASVYLRLPTRLVTMPFGLALDPSAQFSDQGRVTVDGRELRAVQVTLPPREGAGGAADLFVVYFEAKSGQVQLVRFSMAGFTPALDASALLGPPTDYVAVVDIWQTVAGLTLPRRAKLHLWRDGAPAGDKLADIDLLSPTLGRTVAAAAMFARPTDAKVLR